MCFYFNFNFISIILYSFFPFCFKFHFTLFSLLLLFSIIFELAHSNPVTAAIIAPNCVSNLLQSLQLRPINPLQSTEGKIIITADVTGQIKVFENNSKIIEWLKS